jgi:hypothetical protein
MTQSSAAVVLSPGRRKVMTSSAAPLTIEFVREMTAEDIEDLNTVPVDNGYSPVQRLRYVHHTLARLVAQGVPYAECSAITGHTPNRINAMALYDPAFRELVAHYAGEAQEKFLDVHSRLAALGMTTIEELQERLEVAPERFSHKELFALAELVLDRTGAGVKSGPRAGAGVNVQVNFVPSKEPQVIEAKVEAEE